MSGKSKNIWFFFFFLFLLNPGCSSIQPEKDELEIKFKKIDHFTVNGYEVGVLLYEPYILPQGYILRYHFPVYQKGERKRDFYVKVYGNVSEFQMFSAKKVSEDFMQSQELLWMLEEKSQRGPHLTLKRYESSPTYEEIKKDIIMILTEKK